MIGTASPLIYIPFHGLETGGAGHLIGIPPADWPGLESVRSLLELVRGSSHPTVEIYFPVIFFGIEDQLAA